jgi:4-carboxymuconolactone decarboxylase
MARIPEITHPDQMSEHQRGKWDEMVAGGAGGGSRDAVRGPNKVFLHSPELAFRTARLVGYLRRESDSSLPPRWRELAILATARLADCPSEFASHLHHALLAGVTTETAIALREGHLADVREEDRWVCDLTQQVITTYHVDDETFAKAQEHMSNRGLVELVTCIGYYFLLAAVTNTFQVDFDEDRARSFAAITIPGSETTST